MSGGGNMLSLPPDVLLHVLGMCSGRTVAAAAACCPELCKLCRTPALWRTLCTRAGMMSPNILQLITEEEEATEAHSCLRSYRPWKEQYIKGAKCEHKLTFRLRDEASQMVLDPSRGSICTGCCCECCGRDFKVVARAKFDTSSYNGGLAEEYADVITTLHFAASAHCTAGDESMDRWVEKQVEDFCF